MTEVVTYGCRTYIEFTIENNVSKAGMISKKKLLDRVPLFTCLLTWSNSILRFRCSQIMITKRLKKPPIMMPHFTPHTKLRRSSPRQPARSPSSRPSSEELSPLILGRSCWLAPRAPRRAPVFTMRASRSLRLRNFFSCAEREVREDAAAGGDSMSSMLIWLTGCPTVRGAAECTCVCYHEAAWMDTRGPYTSLLLHSASSTLG